MQKLNILALGVGLGVSWAVCILFAGVISIFGWGNEFVKVMGSVYLGYNPSLVGAIIGAFWAFLDGFIGGVIIALVYNKFIK
jgi:hypothetical protein